MEWIRVCQGFREGLSPAVRAKVHRLQAKCVVSRIDLYAIPSPLECWHRLSPAADSVDTWSGFQVEMETNEADEIQ